MIAFSTDSASAGISGTPTNHFSQDPGPKILVGVGEVQRERVGGGQRQAEDGDEHQRRHDVDEHAEQALGGQRDLRVPGAAPALADVAGRRLHRDHVPQDREEPGEHERQADVHARRGVEAGDVAPVDHARVEERQEDHRGDRQHGQHAEHGGERRAEPDAQIGRDEDYREQGEADENDGHPDRRAPGASRPA